MKTLNKSLSRREFLKRSFLGVASFGTSALLVDTLTYAREGKGLVLSREALNYEKVGEKLIRCLNCPNTCLLEDGDRGFCKARENRDGKLYTLGWSDPCAVHVDPIEKKPLFHFLPGTTAFSIATAGCNFRCKFCQNWQISQVPPEETFNFELYPLNVVEWAKREGCRTIAYTYSEPTVFYEYMLETSKIARKKGIRNIYHSNGYINRDPLEALCEWLDGANIDLKGFTDQFYGPVCAGKLAPVLNTLKILREKGVHLEITNLVIPELNDQMDSIGEMCSWIRDNLGENIPLHFSRFYPMYRLKNLPQTPAETLERARETALKVGLNYVYIGNVPGHEGENTYCPGCGELLIRRRGFAVRENNLANGRCRFCQEEVPGVWD